MLTSKWRRSAAALLVLAIISCAGMLLLAHERGRLRQTAYASPALTDDALSKDFNSEYEDDDEDGPDEYSDTIDINTATLAELATLPGIGEKTAQKIIDYREDRPFESIEDIMNVPTIGEKKFLALQDFISVDDE